MSKNESQKKVEQALKKAGARKIRTRKSTFSAKKVVRQKEKEAEKD
jgi:hypothetical protein